MLYEDTIKIFVEGGGTMRGKIGAIGLIALVVTWLLALPVKAIVVEDLLAQYPPVALLNSWDGSGQAMRSNALVTATDPARLMSEETSGLPVQTGTVVRPDDLTVEIVPIRLPDLPTYAVFAIYLVGALVFYTLLVLVAQPGPMEYY